MNEKELQKKIAQGLIIPQKTDDGTYRLIDASGFVTSEIILTIGILVSNRIQWIENVMESIKPLLDNLPCELIAVDTVDEGKSDGSIEVVRKYTDKIYKFKWCNDFAAARNVTLENAKGQWYLFIDDDEWFDDVTELIQFFKSGEHKDYLSGGYEIRSVLPDGSYSGVQGRRLLRRKPNTRFEGRIHESPNEMSEPFKKFSMWAHHMGYCLTTEEEVRAHQKRNMTILQEEIDEKGYDAHRCSQMVQEMIFTPGTQEQGYEYLISVLPKIPPNEMTEVGGQWMLSAGVRHLLDAGKYEETINKSIEFINTYELKELALLIICWCASMAAANLDDRKRALFFAENYVECYKYLKERPNALLVQSGLDMTKFIGDDYANKMLKLIEICKE